jgi:ribosome-binding ATPase YchF (GTP1/OBG family)
MMEVPDMKLAEGLSQRKDLQARISQLKDRLINNVKVQEGNEPAEDPEELKQELDCCLERLEKYIFRINKTNMQTITASGKTLTQMMAERDVLAKRLSVLREVYQFASQTYDRYSRNEIRTVTTIDVKPLHKEIDHYSQQYRELDMEIQALNFTVDLLE